MAGVEAVFTGADIAKFLEPMPIGTPFPSPEHHAVAIDTVRYVGEPVAVVVAGDRYLARDAADAIVVDVRPAAGGGGSRAGDDRPAGRHPPRLSEQPRRSRWCRAALASRRGKTVDDSAIDKAFADS